jgi:hypothetical protein
LQALTFKFHITKDWKGSEIIPFKKYAKFIRTFYQGDLIKELKAYPPSYKPAGMKYRGKKALRNSWVSKDTNISREDAQLEIFNDKVVTYQGRSWNLIDLLHEGTRPGYSAKSNNPTGLMTFFYNNKWVRTNRVRGINEQSIGGHDMQLANYSMRKLISKSLMDSVKRADREILFWQPPQ